jgi:hypothetical protein
MSDRKAFYRAGIFAPYEMFLFFQRNLRLTQPKMAELGLVGSDRQARNIINQGKEQRDCREANREFHRRADPPVTWGWDREYAHLQELAASATDHRDARERLIEIGDSTMAPHELHLLTVDMRHQIRVFRADGSVDSVVLRHNVSKAMYSGRFCMTMAKLAGNRTEKRTYDERGAKIFGLLSHLLEASGESTTPAGALLKFKADANRMACLWNLIPKHRRNSIQMRRFVERSKYIETLASYAREHKAADRVADRGPALDALGTASRFSMRNWYDELHHLLIDAAPEYADPERVKASGKNPCFDSDFDDFMAWWKEKRLTTKQKHSAAAVEIMAVAVFAILTFIVPQPAHADKEGLWLTVADKEGVRMQAKNEAVTLRITYRVGSATQLQSPRRGAPFSAFDPSTRT